ncbi:MAG: murein biosynthesis integral membrane protein MurJ [Litoreibacter sp.]|nr:murein biosynthesis integral membrane protein MurJ [Litoreibacter sp.]
MSQPIRLMRGFATVGSWTLLSRVLGFVRDVLIAGFLGAGPVAEAFLIAFSLPNMFRRFFAEGAFNMAFVPMFSKKLEAGEGAKEFAEDAFAGLGTILIVFTLLATIFMPYLVLAMASGFVADERFELAVLFGRIAFPYILFISLAALLSGVLNASGRFIAAAAAPVLLNILFIAALSGAWWLGLDLGRTLAWTVPVAGLAQLWLVWTAAARAGYRLVPKRPQMTPEMKRLAIIAAPAALAGGVVQVNLLVGRQVASYFDGAVAWLNYADRLYQLPLGVVAIAIGVVLLPDLSRKLQNGDAAGGQEAFNRAGELALALTVPCAVALMVIPTPLISVLFERGQFGPDDSAATAVAVAVYGLGLPAFVLQKVFQPLFFAREDTKRPFYFALVALVVNAVIAIGLAPVVGYIAAALGTTLAGWAMGGLLWIYARRFGTAAEFDTRFRRSVPRIILASVLMGGVLYLLYLVLGGMFGMAGWRYLGLAVLLVAGGLSYALIGQALGAFRLRDIRAALRR